MKCNAYKRIDAELEVRFSGHMLAAFEGTVGLVSDKLCM